MGNATKAAVNAATTTLATELGPRNIRVNSINPAGDHIKESRRPAFTKAISANQWRPATCSVASAGSRYCSRSSFPGLRRRRAMPCKVFVPGRTADPGRVQRRGQSLDPSAWHPFGWSADAELLQRAVTASRVLVTADLDLPRLARWLGASVPGLIRYAEGTTVRRTAWNGSDRFWRRLPRMS
jgi:NAD(P)-dependent dehydrogenase (short-subunit alcohol dehydrogenase family)